MSEEFELCSFAYGEPVELLEMWCNVCGAWEVESHSGCRVQKGYLQSSGEVLTDHSVEGAPGVHHTCEEGMCDGFLSAG